MAEENKQSSHGHLLLLLLFFNHMTSLDDEMLKIKTAYVRYSYKVK